jgi:phage terminase small subunit
MDPIEEIKGLYFKASKETIAQDFARAIDLLKSLPDEATRERAAVYMEGLAQMRTEWQRPRKRSSKG